MTEVFEEPYRMVMIVDDWQGAEIYELEFFEPYVYWVYGGTA